MTKVSRSHSELFFYDRVAANYMKRMKDADNKLVSAIRKVSKQLSPIIDEYNEAVDNAQLDNCLCHGEEKKFAVMKDERGNRMYSVEGEKKLKAAIKELSAKKVEIHSRIPEGIEDIIDTLTEQEKEVFSEIIIPKQETPDEND